MVNESVHLIRTHKKWDGVEWGGASFIECASLKFYAAPKKKSMGETNPQASQFLSQKIANFHVNV